MALSVLINLLGASLATTFTVLKRSQQCQCQTMIRLGCTLKRNWKLRCEECNVRIFMKHFCRRFVSQLRRMTSNSPRVVSLWQPEALAMTMMMTMFQSNLVAHFPARSTLFLPTQLGNESTAKRENLPIMDLFECRWSKCRWFKGEKNLVETFN